jgi:hypothetical protein
VINTKPVNWPVFFVLKIGVFSTIFSAFATNQFGISILKLSQYSHYFLFMFYSCQVRKLRKIRGKARKVYKVFTTYTLRFFALFALRPLREQFTDNQYNEHIDYLHIF